MENIPLYHILKNYKQHYDYKSFYDTQGCNDMLRCKLQREKNKIDNEKNWDIAKKYANNYEFIFSFNNDGVSNKNPISRSYFKLIEILKDNGIHDNMVNIKTACLCEGPGGFIQAINDVYTDRLYPIDCITLISNNKKVPNWKLSSIDNYRISYGADSTGNLYNIENINHFVNVVGKNSCNLVTADGGFDFSNDFNSQETNFLLLLLCEIYTCLNIQAEDGVFIVKVFDLFDMKTMDMISLLRMFYDTLTIQKPKTSRPANSEKYIICKNFTLKNYSILSSIQHCISNKYVNLEHIIPSSLRYDTLKHIYEYNKIFVEKQIQQIEKTLNLLRSNQFDKRKNIELCIEWCEKYNIPIKKDLV